MDGDPELALPGSVTPPVEVASPPTRTYSATFAKVAPAPEDDGTLPGKPDSPAAGPAAQSALRSSGGGRKKGRAVTMSGALQVIAPPQDMSRADVSFGSCRPSWTSEAGPWSPLRVQNPWGTEKSGTGLNTGGLLSVIWDCNGTAWRITHQFNKGLEVDWELDTALSASDRRRVSPSRKISKFNRGKVSRVHLPCTSMRSLQQLRTCLQKPRAVELDVELPEIGTWDGAEAKRRAVFKRVLAQLDDVLPESVAREAAELLATRDANVMSTSVRSKTSSEQDEAVPGEEGTSWETASQDSEDLVKETEEGTESLDVSVCPVQSLDKTGQPLLAFARLSDTVQLGELADASPVRFVAVVLCPASCSPEQALIVREIAHTIAVAFMDESFAMSVRAIPKDEPESFVQAFDSFIQGITIVPTVWVFNGNNEREAQLSDSLVFSIESLIAKQKGVKLNKNMSQSREHRIPNPLQHHIQSPKSNVDRQHFFIEVSHSSARRWRVTRRLRQGLELDVEGRGTRPHLPRVSITALAHARRLMTPASISLDVPTSQSEEVVSALISLLRNCGMAGDSPMEERLHGALTKRLVTGEDGRTVTKVADLNDDLDAQNLDASQCRELLRGEATENACHVMTLSVAPEDSEIMGVFVRLAAPLSLRLPNEACFTRFLFVLVGPSCQMKDITQMSDSLAAISADEDLMSSLVDAPTSAAFTEAFDQRLNSIQVVPKTHLTRSFTGGPSRRTVRTSTTSSAQSFAAFASTKSKRSVTTIKSSQNAIEEDREHCVQFSNEKTAAQEVEESDGEAEGVLFEDGPAPTIFDRINDFLDPIRQIIQKYSLPLVLGVTIALVWSNIHEESYLSVIDGHWFGWVIFNHPITLHFIVNDIFMCFFFGLAVKEVTEALLPGGSLSPLKKAVNPLIATAGGVFGPAAVYIIVALMMWYAGSFEGMMCEFVVVDSMGSAASGGGDHGSASSSAGAAHRLLGGSGSAEPTVIQPCDLKTILMGWGVPTATDISLAWMFAVLIFGAGHSAINFLLLLAIVDDAIGMVIIAVAYPDPKNPVRPEFLLLVVAGSLVAYVLRKLNVSYWQAYILFCWPLTWAGLILAHVHPALALVGVVPFMPASHAAEADPNGCDLGACDLSAEGATPADTPKQAPAAPGLSGFSGLMKSATSGLRPGFLSERSEQTSVQMQAVGRAVQLMALYHNEEAPLHVFEHSCKFPVDIGMFFFGAANAGVKLDAFGPITVATFAGLFLGKTLFITFFAVAAKRMGFGLPKGVTISDLVSMSMLGGVGLTVALFVANEAFVDPYLQGQAKFGAVLSVFIGPLAYGTHKLLRKLLPQEKKLQRASSVEQNPDSEKNFDDIEEEFSDDEQLEEQLVQEMMELMVIQRRYKNRGTTVCAADFREKNTTGRKASKLVNLAELQSAQRRSSSKDGARSPGSARGPRSKDPLYTSEGSRGGGRRSSSKDGALGTRSMPAPGLGSGLRRPSLDNSLSPLRRPSHDNVSPGSGSGLRRPSANDAGDMALENVSG